MIQTKTEQKLQQMEKSIQKRLSQNDSGVLYKPEPVGEEPSRFGYPKEMFSIMGS